MGAVFRALEPVLGVERAIKVIRADQSDDPFAAEFFLREAHALLDVQHEAVVRCEDLLRDDAGRFYLVMELIEGPSLAEWLSGPDFDESGARVLLQRIGQGLAAAHACGVIHRDVSPDNILLPEGRPERAKLIDFGLAKLVATGEQTIQEGFKGRVSYASPEQFGLFGGRVDHRSDIYSLGLVVAEAASGRRLFAHQNFLEAIEARRSVPGLPGELDPDLRSLVEWMLEPDPARRPDSVAALLGSAAALGEIEQRTPTLATARRRPSPPRVPPPAPMLEKRQLTVLVCDLVDSAALAASLDIEDFDDVLQEYQDLCASVLERYDAEVARSAGSALVVYFGYPHAHEDDPRRAILAGLDMVATLREFRFGRRGGLDLRLAARAGIHTGPVVVGGGRQREATSRSAPGHTVDLAVALLAEAAPATVSVSATTLDLVRGGFAAVERGSIGGQAGAQALRAYTIVEEGGVSRGPAGEGRDDTPLVAREADLRRLEDAWEAVTGGHGRALFLSGEAGVGKSRLIRTFRERIALREHAWLECACSALATNSPLFPVLGLVGQLARLDREKGGVAERRDLVAELERPAIGSNDWLPLFRKILSLVDPGEFPEESPERLRRRALVALADWVHDFAARQPAVLVVEDLHWSDPSTREFFSLLLRRLADVPLLCLVTHRPEFVVPWADSEHVSTQELGRLSETDAEALVERMRESTLLPAAVRRDIAARAGGVPLFVEELVKAAASGRASTGIDASTEIPASLQGSLLARLDRLGGAKRVAQIASALGRDFPYRLLAAIVDEPEDRLRASLAELVRAEILCWSGTARDADLCFKHALLQDAVYGTLLRRNRRSVHRRVARAIERAWPERVRQQPEVLAFHLFEGGEPLGAAGAWRAAGRRAVGEAAYEEGLAHYARGLSAIEQCAPSVERDRNELSLRILLGNAIMATRGYGDSGIRSVWERAAELGEVVEDYEEWSSAVNGAAVHAMQTGDCAAAVEQATRLVEVARERGIRLSALRGHGTLAQAMFYRGDGRAALEHAEESLRHYLPGDYELVTYGIGYDQAVIAHGAASLAHWWLGHFDRSLDSALAGLAHASSIRSSQTMAMALTFLSFSRLLRRETEPLLEVAAKVEAMAVELRFPVWHALSLVMRGAARAWRYRDPVGLEMIDRGTEILSTTNEQSGAGFALSLRAEALAAVGRRDEALATAELGLAVSSAMDQPYFMPELLRIRGEMLLDTSVDDGEQGLRAAVADAGARGTLALELRAATSLARLWAAQGGRETEVRSLLGPILERTSEGAGTCDVEAAAALLREAGATTTG